MHVQRYERFCVSETIFHLKKYVVESIINSRFSYKGEKNQ